MIFCLVNMIMSLNIALATNNLTKARALKDVLEKLNIRWKNFIIYEAASEVADAPCGSDVALGVKNRVKNLIEHFTQNYIDNDLFVALETGMVEREGQIFVETQAYAVFRNQKIHGYSRGIPIPETEKERFWQKSHREISAILGEKTDLCMYFTNGRITRVDTFRDSLTAVLTCVKF